jgi:hypothetical protein
VDFELTEGQKQALAMSERLMADRSPCMPAILTGFAGTGKTTMLKAIASRFGAPAVLAPTGKAALRVQEATGLRPAPSTAGSTRSSRTRRPGRWSSAQGLQGGGAPLQRAGGRRRGSMVGRDLWEHLWDMCQLLDLKILLVGDPFQLAPVEPKKDRQGREEPGQRSWTCDRVPGPPERGHPPGPRQPHPPGLDAHPGEQPHRPGAAAPEPGLHQGLRRQVPGDLPAGGAVIVHKNDTRHRINATIRDRLGYGRSWSRASPCWCSATPTRSTGSTVRSSPTRAG